jgi:hypothetical protein
VIRERLAVRPDTRCDRVQRFQSLRHLFGWFGRVCLCPDSLPPGSVVPGVSGTLFCGAFLCHVVVRRESELAFGAVEETETRNKKHRSFDEAMDPRTFPEFPARTVRGLFVYSDVRQAGQGPLEV